MKRPIAYITAPWSGDGKLRFEDEAPAADTATSGQVGPKSGRKRQRLREEPDQPKPSERLRQAQPPASDPASTEAPPPAGADDLAGEGAPTSGDIPPGDTSGQFGPKSKREQKQERQTKKSKLRMERTDEKLEQAKEKLAAKPPPKKPGAVKKLGRAAGRTAHGYVHGKIYQVERENVGTEAAHKTELTGEAVGGTAIRYAKRRYRSHHSVRVQKLQAQQVKARADYGVRAAAQEHPELQSTPLSRYLQKQRLKRQYVKEAKAATQTSAGAVKRAAEATGRAAVIKIDQCLLKDSAYSFEDLSKMLNQKITEAYFLSNSIGELSHKLDAIFLSQLDTTIVNASVAYTMKMIQDSKGLIQVKDLAQEVFYSEKQLNRLFQRTIGTSIKTFSRIVRINYAAYLLEQPIALSQLAEQSGHYDTAHFAHDFKDIYGLTPVEYVKNMSLFYNDPFKLNKL